MRAGGKNVLFVPLRTAVLCPFSFPFGRRGSLRDAIKFTFRPILGGLAEKLSMVPQVTLQRSDLTQGAAWFVSKEEIDECEENFGKDIVLLPAPAAFAAEMEDGGISVWSSPSSSCAIWFDKGSVPRFYKYMPSSEGDAEDLCEWMCRYASAEGADLPSESVLICREGSMTQEELRRAAEASFAASPSLSRLDLSSRGAAAAERCDVFSSACFAALKSAAAVGVLFLVLSLVLLLQNKRLYASLEEAPREICGAVLGERGGNPLAYAAKRLRMLSGESSRLSFEKTLADIASAFEELPDKKAVRIDSLRYGSERTEVEGTASKTDDIQKLRDAFGRKGFSAKTGGVQQIPGGGMRFTLTLSAGENVR
ncbi:MAG: hypothetical protein IJM42_03995 [Synergistes sp.]|nr:hypothetical protein [Synergistes sp.]